MSDAKCKCKWYNMYICTQKLSCIQRANVMIGYDMIVRAVQSLPGCWSSQSTLCTFLSQELPFEGSSQSFCTCRVMKNFLQQLKIVPTLESSGMFIQKLMQDFVKQQFFTGGKRGFDPKYIVSITTTAGEADKNHINPSSCLGCGSGSMHVPVYIGTAIKQFQYRTTGYLVLTQPHIFKLSTVQQQSQ